MSTLRGGLYAFLKVAHNPRQGVGVWLTLSYAVISLVCLLSRREDVIGEIASSQESVGRRCEQLLAMVR